MEGKKAWTANRYGNRYGQGLGQEIAIQGETRGIDNSKANRWQRAKRLRGRMVE